MYLLKSFKNVVRFGAIMMSIAIVAGCGNDDDTKPAAKLETISITAPVARVADRTITDRTGEFAYTDKANATVKMTFANAEPKDSSIVINNLNSRVTWLTTPKKFSPSGTLTYTPTLTGTNKITVRYGALVVTDLFTVTNTAFSVTRSGKSADMPFFGFLKVEAVGDVVYQIVWSNETGITYEVHTLTQKFRLMHSDGTTKEVEFIVLESEKK